MRRRQPDSVRITSASRPRSEDIRGRERRYLISMAVRTGCVVLAVVFMGSWLMWVFLFGAVFLPYVAVVVANTTNPDPGGPEAFRPDLPALGTGPSDRPLEP
jgi:hypothetical protein